MKRVFLIVLDSVGVGEMPDAAEYGDAGSNTLLTVSKNPHFHMPNMRKLGLFNIDGVCIGVKEQTPQGSFARLKELSKGKDTTIGHWEIAGVVSPAPLPVYPDGFPDEIIEEFKKRTGRGVLCNRPYSGTEVIKDYGAAHVKSGDLIVYTSADSVFQVAAHEDAVPVETLYEYCKIAREMLQGVHGVGRVIARPFAGEDKSFYRTGGRHDYSLQPPGITMLDQLKEAGKSVISVGKIADIFAGRGITERALTSDNAEGIEQTLSYMEKDFEGLCFTNLVDFDMRYGHRRDADGYAEALSYFDRRLPEILGRMKEDDVLMITADHGCDPGAPGTDHTREYAPFLITGEKIPSGINYGTREGFCDIAATVLHLFGIRAKCRGKALKYFY